MTDVNTIDQPVDTIGAEIEQEIVASKATYTFREPSKEAKNKNPSLVKRPTVELTLPYLTELGLVSALTSGDEKVIGFIVSIVNNVIYDAGKEQVNDETHPVSSQEELDESKLTLEYLANQTTERKTSGISKDEWIAFEKDYIAVMPELVQKEVAKIEKAAKILVGRYQSVKTSKAIVETLQPMVATWFTSKGEEDQERWAPIFKFLDDKATELLAVTDESLLKDLV